MALIVAQAEPPHMVLQRALLSRWEELILSVLVSDQLYLLSATLKI
jgi:hypothetical protein